MEPVDLLSALNGARVVTCSNANFSPPENLLRPDRGVDMSGGWESSRTQEGRGKYGPQGALRGQERKEWVVVKMAATGVLRYAEVDTAFHPGNYPKACSLEAVLSDEVGRETRYACTRLIGRTSRPSTQSGQQ